MLPLRRCSACGFEFFDNESDVLQHEAVCNHLGVMDRRRKFVGSALSWGCRVRACALDRLGEATIARWERGALIQNEAMIVTSSACP